jgi:hypothetical protein
MRTKQTIEATAPDGAHKLKLYNAAVLMVSPGNGEIFGLPMNPIQPDIWGCITPADATIVEVVLYDDLKHCADVAVKPEGLKVYSGGTFELRLL